MSAKIGVLLISLFIGSLAIPAPVEDDLSDFFIHTDPSSRIVGGSAAAPGSAPHMVALSDGLFIRSFVCGGSIVARRHVLTAAHCIAAVFSWGSLSNNLRVTVGTNQWNLGGQTYRLARNVTHPNYLSSTIKNDIGVLITSTDIVLSNLVAPVPLTFDQVDGGVLTRVTGWGRIAAGGSLSSSLLELFLNTLDGQQCVDAVAQASIDFNTRAPPVEPHIEICTFHSPGHGTCNGDSGSALVRVSDGRQVGVVSWGFPCARGAPDMFARVGAFSEFILNAIA